MAGLPSYLTDQAELLNLASEPAPKTMTIDGRDYPVGVLNEKQWAEIEERGTRIIAARNSYCPLSERDSDPKRNLWHLLLAGDPAIRKVGRISLENLLDADREMMRQAVVRALGKFDGSA